MLSIYRLLIAIFCIVSAYMVTVVSSNNGYRILKNVFEDCQKKTDVTKCFKMYALKAADRAVKSKGFSLFDGVSIVKVQSNKTERNLPESHITFANLEHMDTKYIDLLLWNNLDEFLSNHRIQLSFLQEMNEGRGRRRNRYLWPVIAALVIKSVIMAVSYKGVAAMSGAALILGKMALVLSAILGLKKLVGGGHDHKTTFEIVKHPHHSQSHSYSSSYDESDGHYHRSMGSAEEMMMLERIYKNQIPKY